ncbi:LysE family translocator [Roseateles oligotrophus]|uniref:LysE family translocator n=1 Tax=Roseateles oligotrophus TaxID=1769250 RepID=A0ABT2YDC3_9BURK|nr:LysE family translocator [Roseateles oligotrophus]MCV2368048.1 LysE family translocator [Roseateles oligotrophus]
MMTLPTLFAVIAFATVTSITPGPNNMMLLASGVNHGFKKTLPHIAGISIGLLVLLLAAGLGLGALLQQWPQLYLGLKVVGVSYMVWLAWKLWHAEAPTGPAGNPASSGPASLMGFWGAAAFQWVNPKAWMIAIGAVAGFTAPDGGLAAMLGLALICALVNAPCVGLWAFAGAKLSRFLAEPARRRAFNAVMALSLLASIWPMLGA